MLLVGRESRYRVAYGTAAAILDGRGRHDENRRTYYVILLSSFSTIFLQVLGTKQVGRTISLKTFLPSLTGLYWVLLGFTGFYLILLGLY